MRKHARIRVSYLLTCEYLEFNDLHIFDSNVQIGSSVVSLFI
jgi:hypothetical protein